MNRGWSDIRRTKREPNLRHVFITQPGGGIALSGQPLLPIRANRKKRRPLHHILTALRLTTTAACAMESEFMLAGDGFGLDERVIALRNGLRHAIVTENKSVCRVDILNEIGNQAVIANDEPGEGGGSR